ncbi:MAG: UGSC family (seleno)protein [Candidatus Rokuibacteriota bacterium]
MMMLDMEILDPVGSSQAPSRTLAPRLASLQGGVVGVLDNSKPNARVLLASTTTAPPPRTASSPRWPAPRPPWARTTSIWAGSRS